MIIGARTGNCKSAFSLQLAWDLAIQKIPTLFISMEMYEEDVIERLFCLSGRVDNIETLTGQFPHYLDKWDEFSNELKDCPLVITDMIGKTWKQVDEYMRSLDVKPRVVFIDHLQEAKDASLKNQKEVIDEYLKNMRVMAIKNDFALIVASQVNRASQDEGVGKEPQLHHLKASGYIEESADQIILLHWPWLYTKAGDQNKFIVNVAKNRNGRTGWIDIKYNPSNYFFYEEPNGERPETVSVSEWVD